MDYPSPSHFNHDTYRILPTNDSRANSRTCQWQSQYPSPFSNPDPYEPPRGFNFYSAPSRVPDTLTSRTQPYGHPVRAWSYTSDRRTHDHGPPLPVPIGTVPVAPGPFLGEHLGPPQLPPSQFRNDVYQPPPTDIPRQSAPYSFQPESHRPELHRPLHSTYPHSSDRNDDEDTHPARLHRMPWSSRQSMQRIGHRDASQPNVHPNLTHPSRPGLDTYFRGTNYDLDPSVVSWGGARPPHPDQQHGPLRSSRYDDACYRSSPTYNSHTDFIITQQPAPSSHDGQEPLRPVVPMMPNSPSRVPSPPQHTVTPPSSSYRQDLTQVPDVSPPHSDPRPASMPSLSQPSSQLGLTRLPSDHIRTTLAMLPNEQPTGALPSEVDTKLPNSGDTSRGMPSPGEQHYAGSSAASSGVPASESSKHTVTPPGSSPRRRKSAQAPSPSSPLDPLPVSTPWHLNEPQKPARPDNGPNQTPPARDSQAISHISPPSTSPSYEITSHRPEPPRPLKRPDFPSSDGNIEKYNRKATPGSSSPVSGSSNQTVTSGVFSPSRGLTQRSYCSSPPSNPLLASAPSSSPSPSVKPVPPDFPSSDRSANNNRKVAPESSSSTRSSGSGSPKYTVTSESSLHQELTLPALSYSGDKSGGIAVIAPPDVQPHGGLSAEPSSVSDAPRVTVTLEPSSLHLEPTHPVSSYSGGIALFDERRHESPAEASCWAPESTSPIVTFAESEPYGGSTNGIMWDMLQ